MFGWNSWLVSWLIKSSVVFHGVVSPTLGLAQGGSGGLEFVTTKDTMCIWWSPKLRYYSTKSLSIRGDHLRGVKRGTCQLDLEVWPSVVNNSWHEVGMIIGDDYDDQA